MNGNFGPYTSADNTRGEIVELNKTMKSIVKRLDKIEKIIEEFEESIEELSHRDAYKAGTLNGLR